MLASEEGFCSMELFTVAMEQVYLLVLPLSPAIVIPQLLQVYHHVTGAVQLQQVAAAIKSIQKKASHPV
ncbi:MAG: hypothetical protein FWF98_06100 [Dehalococcoidia bacterium]|jgi:hypothetical protein|nr:hypothetical protein [Dehalococcoidia bacterium]